MKTIPGYVTYEPSNSIVNVGLEGGRIDLSVFLCNETDSSNDLLNAITTWAEDAGSSIIAPHFTVAGPVDYLIDMNQMPSYNNRIDIDAKPIFEALRAEMMNEISRIDRLVFASTGVTDVDRYQFLRNVFATDAPDDTVEFGKLARLTGANFDSYVDAAMKAHDDKQLAKPTTRSAA